MGILFPQTDAMADSVLPGRDAGVERPSRRAVLPPRIPASDSVLRPGAARRHAAEKGARPVVLFPLVFFCHEHGRSVRICQILHDWPDAAVAEGATLTYAGTESSTRGLHGTGGQHP